MEVLITEGQYSRYHILGLVHVPSREWLEKQILTFSAMQAEAEDAGDYTSYRYYPDDSDKTGGLVQWLVSRGAEHIEQAELHIAGHGPATKEDLEWT